MNLLEMFFSANVHYCLPHIPWQDHAACYAEWRAYHRPRPLAGTAYSPGNIACMDKPGIIALFHLGDHASMPMILATGGLKFDILISKAVYDRYADSLQAARPAVAPDDNAFQYLYSEDPNVLWRIRDTLRADRHILIFADGNTGTKSQSVDLKNSVEVAFFENVLQVRPGIGFLADIFGVPVYPVINKGTPEAAIIEIPEIVYTTKGQDRHYAVQGCMQVLFKHLQDRLQGDHWIWEGWGNMHTNGMLVLPAGAPAPLEEGGVPIERAAVFKMGGETWVFDRAFYQMYRKI